MGLIEDIEEEALLINSDSKKDNLLSVTEEIILMIEKKIPLPKQIELLIKNNIIDSIDLKYYRTILKLEFGYITDKKTLPVPVKKIKPVATRELNKPIKETVTEMLSKSVELSY